MLSMHGRKAERMMGERETGQVRSVAKAITLLDILLERRAPMTLQELSAASGYPKSTVHAMLSTLRGSSVISQGDDGRYSLGIRLFEYGCAVSAAWDVTRVAHPYLEQLADSTGASAFLSILSGNDVISFDQCAGGAGLQVIPETGSRLPLHATSQGKLLLAYLSGSDAAKRAREGGMRAFTPHTVTELPRLLALLQTIRSDGYAVEDGEYKIGLRSVSAPVRDSGGRVRYAMGVVGLFRHVRSVEFQNAVALTVEQAERLSRALGYQRRESDGTGSILH